MKKVFLTSLTLSLALATGMAHAFGLDDLKKAVTTTVQSTSSASSTSTSNSLVTEQNNLFSQYQSAAVKLLEAKSSISSVLGLTSESKSLKEQATELAKSTISNVDWSKFLQADSSSTNSILSLKDKVLNLTSSQKSELAKSASEYVSALGDMGKAVTAASNFSSSVSKAYKSASSLKEAVTNKDIASGITLATQIPTQYTEVTSSSKEILSLLKNNGVSTSDAISILTTLLKK